MNIATRFGRYQIQRELGRGSMAIVYQAFDPNSGRDVALKVLPREMLHNPQFRIQFEREVKLVAGLEHAAIVPVYDVGEEDSQPYFVMRYMPGGSLAQRIAKGRLSLPEAARIVGKIAPALAYAHQQGVIHRDLKPDNILFDNDDEPFISDFGIAKLYTGGTGSLSGKEYVGTPAYMSPEQSRGEQLDKRSDVYSLGAIIYEMLTGQKPYHADGPIGVALKHITQPVPKVLKAAPNLPPTVDGLIATAMAKEKEKRYPSVIELAKALNLIAYGNTGNLTEPRARRSTTGWVVAGVILTAAVIGFYLLRAQLFTTPPPAPALPLSSPAETARPATFTAQPSAAPQETSTATFTPAPTFTASALPFAPACPADFVIPAPDIVDIDKFCVKKIPYTTLSIPLDASFEALNPNFSCKVEFTRAGRSTLTCVGTPAYSFQLKVCKRFIPNFDKCEQGAPFIEAGQCCLSAPPADAGCVVHKVDIRACQ